MNNPSNNPENQIPPELKAKVTKGEVIMLGIGVALIGVGLWRGFGAKDWVAAGVIITAGLAVGLGLTKLNQSERKDERERLEIEIANEADKQ